MTGVPRRRGEPLAVLGVVLTGWIALRMVLWEPVGVPVVVPNLRLGGTEAMRVVSPVRNSPVAQLTAEKKFIDRAPSVPGVWKNCSSVRAKCWIPEGRPAPNSTARTVDSAIPDQPTPLLLPREPMLTPRIAAGHQLMMLAALGQLPLPPSLAVSLAPPVGLAKPRSGARASRWSGDGWVLLRSGSDGIGSAPSASPAFGRYGASQAGAVLRYSLAPSSAVRPQIHFRLTRALVGNGESEAALGLSLRPQRSLPVRLYGEARLQRVSGHTRLRPAATLVSELPPVALPLGAQTEIYAAAGYIGGSDATPYFDAQLTADRAVAARGSAELRLGAGAWTGGQEGAARLDLGPRASLRLKIGEVPSRLALDWRFRVAGRAAPASGPALTLSAGF